MYIEKVPNRNSRPAILLREGWREGRRTRKRTLANLTDWPAAQVEALRAVLKGDYQLLAPGPGFSIARTRPHGHVAAVLGTIRLLGLERLLAPERGPERDAVVAMITARILQPRSKLATARELRAATLSSTLGELLNLSDGDEELLYRAMDWLLPHQPQLEQALARRHLKEGTLALSDVSSTYFEGRCGPLARYGYSRDGKADKLQITFGLLTNAEGCPVAVEVFEGNSADPSTLASVITKLRARFGLNRIVLVGDRGMITTARIRDELAPAGGLDWLTALRAPQIRQLVEGGALQLSLFDQRDLAEISHPNYPDERLVACRNPLMAAERARTRDELLSATERARLARLPPPANARTIPCAAQTALPCGSAPCWAATKCASTYASLSRTAASVLAVTSRALRARRHSTASTWSAPACRPLPWAPLRRCAATSAWPRSSGLSAALSRSTSRSGRFTIAWRSGYAPTCCCACWPTLWSGTCARRSRRSCSMTTTRPRPRPRALRWWPPHNAPRARKTSTKLTDDDAPLHSFRTLLSDLATVAKNRILPSTKDPEVVTTPTSLQQHAFDLLKVNYRM